MNILYFSLLQGARLVEKKHHPIKIFVFDLTMRVVKNPQLQLGGTTIEKIKINLNSRDDIPPLLLGLQHLYTNIELREKVFALLKENINPDTANDTGRPGMDLWNILVFGVLRLNLNWDYDCLTEMANNHKTIRMMVGHGTFTDDYEYKLQTLKDNVSLLTPELLDKINTVVVEAGHDIVKKKDDEELQGRCNSFVVETDVHYPTDINLLFDAMRKVITLIAALCTLCGLSGWRQSKHKKYGLDGVVFMYVGNLEKYQGIDFLLESFSQACQQQTEQAIYLLLIGGNADDLSVYRKQIKAQKLEAKVFFCGPRPVTLLSYYLAQADVLVSPRVQGGNTPMKIYSYLDSGVPVLATRLETHTQVLDKDIAYLVETNKESMVKGMITLAGDEMLRQQLAQAAKQRVRENYSLAAFQGKLQNFYRQLPL